MPITIWWTPSHYGDASADEYAEIQRALNASGLFKVTLKSAEWAQYSGALGKQYGAFQLGWFPDYPDADDYIVPFYQPNSFYNNGYSNKQMNGLIAKERAAPTTRAAPEVPRADAGARGQGRCRRSRTGRASMIAVGRTQRPGHPRRRWMPRTIMRFWLLSKSLSTTRREGRLRAAPLLD